MKSFLNQYNAISSDIPGSLQFPGALTWDSLLSYQTENKVVRNFLEIGVLHGKSAMLSGLYAQANNTQQVIVDPGEWMDTTYSNLLSRIEGLNLRLINDYSSNLNHYSIYKEHQRDYSWFHIDGDHSYTQCYKDLILADHFLSDYGVVIVDDFFSTMFPQVTASTFSYLEKHPLNLKMFLVGQCNKAYLCRPPAFDFYKKFCIDVLSKDMKDQDYPVTITKTTYPQDFDCYGYQPIGWTDDRMEFRGPDWDRTNFIKYT